MATARLTCFITPEEFASLMERLGAKLELCFFAVTENLGAESMPVQLLSINTVLRSRQSNLRVCRRKDVPPSMMMSRRELFKAALVTAPLLEQGALYMTELAAKDDWFDVAGKFVEIIPGGVSLVRSMRNQIDVWCDGYVFARQIGTGGRGRYYRDIKCTKGAKMFFERGGNLRSHVAKNVEYFIFDHLQ